MFISLMISTIMLNRSITEQLNISIHFYLQAEVAEWISSKHNMGMAFTRREWNKILSCREQFCKVKWENQGWRFTGVLTNFTSFSLMTTTGTGLCSASLTTVCRTSSRWSWPRAPECSTSETGEKKCTNIGLLLLSFAFSGVHHKKSNCDSNAGLDKVKSIIKSAQKYLFPSR